VSFWKSTQSFQSKAFWISLVSILVVLGSNLIFPKSYSFFAWSYGSYFPVVWQLAWAAICIGLMFVLHRFRLLSNNPSPTLTAIVVLAALSVLSLWIFQSPYPSMSGDNIPDKTFRLRAFANDIVNHYFLNGKNFKQATLLAEQMWGVLYILIAAFCSWKFRGENKLISLGLFVYAVTVPPFLTASGFYDGYTTTIITQAIWWLAFWNYHHRTHGKSEALALLLILTFTAIWAHPLNLLLAGMLVFYFFDQTMTQEFSDAQISRFRTIILLLGPVIAGIACILIYKPNYFLHGPYDEDFFPPMDTRYFLWHLHSSSMNFLMTCLPGCVLALWVFLESRRSSSKFCSFTLTVIIGMISAFVFRFSLPFLQGIDDEFAAGALGLAVCFGGIVLFLKRIPTSLQDGIVCIAIFSAYLFLPRLILNHGDRYVQYYRDMYPHDQCQKNHRLSPYIALGLSIPWNEPRLRDIKLQTFLDGYVHPIKPWERHRIDCLEYYIAWSYELGKPEQARAALKELASYFPSRVFGLCQDDWTMAPRSVAFIRKDGLEIFDELWRQTRDERYHEAWKALKNIDSIFSQKKTPNSPELWNDYRWR
jgi:hypothetical protein